jgi:hypothetical protein
MKHTSLLFISIVTLFACHKEDIQEVNLFLHQVKTDLEQKMTPGDCAQLDYGKAVLSFVDSAQLYFLRIPFKGNTIHTDFVLLQTSREGNVQKGRIISLRGGHKEYEGDRVKRMVYNGHIAIYSLDRKNFMQSNISNGYIEAFHAQNNRLAGVVQPGEDVLPEVIVVAYVRHDFGISVSDWMYLQRFFYDDIDFSGSAAYYSPMEGGGGTYSGDYGSGYTDPLSTDYGLPTAPVIQVNYDAQADNGAIELEKFINCFTQIPDAGATCSIEIYADIPIDADPNKLLDFNSGSPGHSFIQIKKSNGGQSAIQNLGFYPKTGWKTGLTNAPIEGKFVDNGSHEFNVSFKMELNPNDFASTLTEILYLKNMMYDIDNFNCTDWALEVFNKTRTNKLQIPLYDLPGNYPSTGTSTPQGLYQRLKQMAEGNDPEAGNITIGFSKGWVAASTGPCN